MRLLDLYCGIGGCSVGYTRAGFTVTGVDVKRQRDYPFEFVHADALEVLADATFLAQFDVIHASPPCQAFTRAAKLRDAQNKKSKIERDDMPHVMDALREWGGVWIVENVPAAPMTNPATLCGSAFGLRVRRHRLFDSNVLLMEPGCYHDRQGTPVGVYHQPRNAIPRGGTTAKSLDDGKDAMGIEWASTWVGLKEAIPPAYTQYLGEQLRQAVTV